MHVLMHDIKLLHPVRDFRFWSQALVIATGESTLKDILLLGKYAVKCPTLKNRYYISKTLEFDDKLKVGSF